MTLQDAGAAAERVLEEVGVPDREGIEAVLRDLLDWEQVLPILIRLGFIFLLAFISYRILKVFTRRLVRREVEDPDPLVKRVREQRAQTIGSLFNSVGLVIVIIITLLMVLGTFDINLGPLLATAGVAGLAISFGAQSLVKDVITGSFLLMEGQFAIGDVVRVGDIAGQVEKITLRTTIMRDLHGVVHIIPNGEITKLSNLTKTWSRAVIDIGVAYREDVDRVLGVLRETMTEFHEDPEWGQLLLEEPQVLGIQDFLDSAVSIRISTKTLPLKQWDVARELRRRIKKRFDRDGIEIPFPHRTIYWGEGQGPASLGTGAAMPFPDVPGVGGEAAT